jgi:hypothetical protein
LRGAWKALHPNAIDAFDIDDELQTDDLACHLLERYRSAGDAEAFALLFELTRPRLAQLAAQLLDTVPDDARADALVVAMMRAMHSEGRAAPPRLSGFAVLAAGRMRGLLADVGPDRPNPLQRSLLAQSA